jgi:hypothetical protein
MFVEFHVDASSAEGDTFHLQAESLLGGVLSGQFDGAAGAEDAMPGQSWDLPQYTDDLTRCSGPACGAGNGSIGGDGSLGQGADGTDDAGALFRGLGSGLAFFFHRETMYNRL